MIKHSILTFIILFFTFSVLAIDIEQGVECVNRAAANNTRKAIASKIDTIIPEMALSPLDFLTVKELQDIELLQVVLEFRRALENEKKNNKRKKPLRLIYSAIEGAFIKSRSRATHAMDMFFFEIWEEFQKLRESKMDDKEAMTFFKSKYVDSIPDDLPTKQYEELASVIDNIDIFA